MDEIMAICVNSCEIGGHKFEKGQIYETDNFISYEYDVPISFESGEQIAIDLTDCRFTIIINPACELKASIEQLYKNNRPE